MSRVDATALALGLIAAHPLLDYLLRHVLRLPGASLWDKLVLLFLLVAAGVHWLVGREERQTPVGPAIGIAMLIGLLWVALDTVSPATAFEGYRAVFQYMLIFFAAFSLVRSQEQLSRLLMVIVILSAAMGLHGVYQYVADVPTPGSWTDAAESIRARAFSIVGSPNALGSQLAFAAPLAAALAWRARNWLWRLIWLGAAGLCGLGLLLTFSRGAWLALFGAIVLFGLIWDRRVLAATLIAAIVVGIGVEPVRERITYLFSSQYIEKSQNDGRIARWLDAYDQMRDEPVFGRGLGRYGGAVAARRYGTTYVDNYYMKTTAETGLFGIGLYLWLQAFVLWHVFQVWRRENDPGHKIFLTGLAMAAVVLLLHNGVENIFEIPYLNFYYWLIIAWLLAWPHLPVSEHEVQEDEAA